MKKIKLILRKIIIKNTDYIKKLFDNEQKIKNENIEDARNHKQKNLE